MDHFCDRQRHRPVQDDIGQWVFTGEMRDHGRFADKCAWCEKQDLRVTFEVRHDTTDDTRQICQACLGHGAFRVEHEGQALEGQERRDYLSELSVRLMHRTCRDVLRNLLTRTDDPALQEVAVYFDRNVQLSPGRAATLLLALSSSKLGADPRIFEVQIRSSAHKQEFGGLTEREKLAVWPVLSPAIRNRLISLGLAPERYAAPRNANARLRAAALQALV
jgi:hypothetical protein